MEHLPHFAKGKRLSVTRLWVSKAPPVLLAYGMRAVERLIAACRAVPDPAHAVVGPWLAGGFLAVHFLQANDVSVQPTQLRLKRGNARLDRRILGADVEIFDIERGDAQTHGGG